MRKITIWLFKQISRFTSYGIGVAATSAVSGALAVIFGIYYSQATGIIVSDQLFTTLQIAVFVGWIFHSLHFGILSKLGFHGFTRSIRVVNRSIQTWPTIRIREDLPRHRHKRLLKALTWLPFANSITSVFWAVFVTAAIYVVSLATGEEEIDLGTGITMLLMVVFIHGGFSYILGEIATGGMRAECKRIMHSKGIQFRDRAFSSVRLKIFFFLGLFALGLYVSNSLTYFNRDNVASVLIFSALAIMISMLMAYLIFYIIYSSLKGIEAALTDLKTGGEGLLHPRSLDKEFINVATGINTAARTIRDYQLNLQQKVTERTKQLQEANAQLEKRDKEMQLELNFAADIQRGMIPQSFEEWNGLRMCGQYRAMTKVSGDYYDAFQAQGGRLGVLMADVSGHGVPAALITTMAKVAFGTASLETFEPAEIFRLVNEQLTPLITTQDYLTAFYVTFEENHDFYYANAAHQYGRIYRKSDQSVQMLDTPGFFIGALPEATSSYSQAKEHLFAGDRLVLYTDGIVERKNGESELYGYERFDAIIRECRDSSIEDMVEMIMRSVDEFGGATPNNDDISVLIIEADEEYSQFLGRLREVNHLIEEGEQVKAANELDRALDLYSRNLTALRMGGLLNYEIGRLDRAEALFNGYIALNDNHAEPFFWLSAIAIRKEAHQEALAAALAAINLRPSYAEALNNAGIAYANLGNKAEARAAFEKALGYDPDNEEIRESLKKLDD